MTGPAAGLGHHGLQPVDDPGQRGAKGGGDQHRPLGHVADFAADGRVAGRAAAEGLLGQALGRIVALAEAYPELKANENFMELHRSLDTIEGEIQMSRRYYNGAARDLNVKVDSFPSNLVASQFGFSKAGYFEIANDADRAVPTVKF